MSPAGRNWRRALGSGGGVQDSDFAEGRLAAGQFAERKILKPRDLVEAQGVIRRPLHKGEFTT